MLASPRHQQTLKRWSRRPPLARRPSLTAVCLSPQCIIRCDEDESHTASMYCTVCATHLCSECSQLTHSTRTLAKHRRVPLADKPHEKTLCPQHQVHAIEFVCLEDACQPGPLMCCVCKEYGKHQGHKVRALTPPSRQLVVVLDVCVQVRCVCLPTCFFDWLGQVTC